MLRHTFASQLVMRGVPLKAVQELLGTRSMEMTMRYAHLNPDVRRDAVRGPAGSRRREAAGRPSPPFWRQGVSSEHEAGGRHLNAPAARVRVVRRRFFGAARR